MEASEKKGREHWRDRCDVRQVVGESSGEKTESKGRPLRPSVEGRQVTCAKSGSREERDRRREAWTSNRPLRSSLMGMPKRAAKKTTSAMSTNIGGQSEKKKAAIERNSYRRTARRASRKKQKGNAGKGEAGRHANKDERETKIRRKGANEANDEQGGQRKRNQWGNQRKDKLANCKSNLGKGCGESR